MESQSGGSIGTMSNSGYFKRVFARAQTMTLADLGLEKPRQVVAKILWTSITFLIFWVVGALDQLISHLGKWGAGAIAFVALIGIFYCVNIARAAAALQGEANATADDLRKQLDDREGRQAAINVLWQLRSDGIGHRNSHVASEEAWGAWRATFEAWHKDILQEAGKVNINLRNYLDRLDRMDPGPHDVLGRALNAEHARLIGIVSEILKRLQAFLTKDLHS